MRPRFRNDLKSSREEQQGVVFYRIDDPDTQTSFRLYEIEYLIAQKLDGQSTLSEVIATVKDEYNFDISEPDLKKFVSQLESMGFIRAEEAEGAEEGEEAIADTEETLPGPSMDDATTTGGAEVTEVKVSEARIADVEVTGGPTQIVDRPTPTPGAGSDAATLVTAASASEIDPSSIPMAPDVEADSGPDIEEAQAATDWELDVTSPGVPGLSELRRALEHLRQGYVVHARDYFLAAKEIRPGEESLSQVVALLDEVADNPTLAEVEQVWQKARALFSELADNLGPDLEIAADAPVAGSGDLGVADEAPRRRGEDDLSTRLKWTALLVAILVAGVGALIWVVHEARIFESAARVGVTTLRAETIPVYYSEPATQVAPWRQDWLLLEGSGKVSIVPEVGSQADAGDFLVMLELKPKVKRKLEKAQASVKKAQGAYDKAAKNLAEVLEERETIEAEREDAQQKLKLLRPKSILKHGGVSPRDLKQQKEIIASANAKLSELAKKERKPRAKERKAKSKAEGALRKLAKIERRIGAKLIKAPYAGVVVELKIKDGKKVAKGEQAILFKDPLAVRLTFKIKSAGDLQPGGEAHVAVERGKPGAAKVLEIEEVADGVELTLKLVDPVGAYSEMKPEAFRLVEQFAEGVYAVDTDAVVDREDGKHCVVVATKGRAARREVELLYRDPNEAIIRAVSGSLKDGDTVVTEYPDHGNVGAILDGAELSLPDRR